MAEPREDETRWRARPAVAAVVVVAVFAVPVACSIGIAYLLGSLWPPAATGGGVAVRWLAILGSSTVVFIGCERLTRRALPLTVLLKMGMAFPGRAPKRLSVARRSWTTRDLSRRIDEARCQGITDEPTEAAEQIVSLAATLSAHDRKTRGHAERVRAFTDLIAEELHLPDDDRDRLRWSALLHDVGKLTVHSDILNKPGALSDDEWEVMRQHPLEGAKLTAPLAGWLGPWANTIAEHHERFDGRGYPYGLSGQEISMGGRIVAVADCYDTMTSLRSYKKPLSADVARTELAACAGAQFDPVMVRAFLAVSVSRLHAVAPLTWIGSLPFGNLGPQLARLAAVGGRLGASSVAATAGVIGLAAGQQAVGSPVAAHRSTPTPGAAGSSSAVTSPPSSGGKGGGRSAGPSTAGSSGGHSSGGASSSHGGSRAPKAAGGDTTTTAPPAGTGGSGSGGDTGAGAPAGTGADTGPTTTVVVGGPVPTLPTTTVPGATTTTTTATTTTTTAPPPVPPAAPVGLSASGSCQVLVVGPEVSLSWTESTDTAVTGYAILRKSGSSFSTIGSVSGRATVTFVDTSVSGLGTVYSYEVEAVAGALKSGPSGSASATTPTLCL